MTKEEFDNIISVSIIDVIGIMDGGLAILFNLLINNKDTYDIIFWYNTDGIILIEAEEKLLLRLGVSDFKEYKNFEQIGFLLYSHIPDPNGLLEKYLTDTTV